MLNYRGLKFESSAAEEAVLAMPDAAFQSDLNNLDRFISTSTLMLRVGIDMPIDKTWVGDWTMVAATKLIPGGLQHFPTRWRKRHPNCSFFRSHLPAVIQDARTPGSIMVQLPLLALVHLGGNLPWGDHRIPMPLCPVFGYHTADI